MGPVKEAHTDLNISKHLSQFESTGKLQGNKNVVPKEKTKSSSALSQIRRLNKELNITRTASRSFIGEFQSQSFQGSSRNAAGVLVVEDPALSREQRLRQFSFRPPEAPVTNKIQQKRGKVKNNPSQSLKAATQEVIKLSTEVAKNGPKMSAKIAWLVSLGAKPPKGTKVPLPHHLEMQRQRRIKKEKQEKKYKKMGLKIPEPPAQAKSKKKEREHFKPNELPKFKSQVGKYKDGMLVLSEKDVSKVYKKK